MSKLQDLSINDYLTKLGSKDPTPGGGASAAVVGAIAASLVEMVSSLTIGKKGYEKVDGRMKEIKYKSQGIKTNLLSLADEDCLAFEKVLEAFRTPKEEANREEKIQEALKEATAVPLKTAEHSFQIMALAEEVAKAGNKSAFSDAQSAFYFAKAAIASALENVNINLSSIKDSRVKAEIEKSLARVTK